MMTTIAPAKSTLDGWLPAVGALVWQQMWNPTGLSKDATIQQRIATGVTYGERKLMRVYAVDACPGGCGHDLSVVHFFLKDPARPTMRLFPTNGQQGPSWVESDWCVLEDAAADEGRLF